MSRGRRALTATLRKMGPGERRVDPNRSGAMRRNAPRYFATPRSGGRISSGTGTAMVHREEKDEEKSWTKTEKEREWSGRTQIAYREKSASSFVFLRLSFPLPNMFLFFFF